MKNEVQWLGEVQGPGNKDIAEGVKRKVHLGEMKQRTVGFGDKMDI